MGMLCLHDTHQEELLGAAARHDGNAIKQKLRELVPEYQPFEL